MREIVRVDEEEFDGGASSRQRLIDAAAASGLTLAPFIPRCRYDQALRAFDQGDTTRLFLSASNMYAPYLLFANLEVFKARGRYESALIYALTAPRTNLAHVPRSVLALLIENADRAALRAAGDPLPHPGPFTVYRGVAGRGGARRVRGLSWTFSLPVAAWFARRFDLPDPAVYRVTVDEAHVLAYVSDREEEELRLYFRRMHGRSVASWARNSPTPPRLAKRLCGRSAKGSWPRSATNARPWAWIPWRSSKRAGRDPHGEILGAAFVADSQEVSDRDSSSLPLTRAKPCCGARGFLVSGKYDRDVEIACANGFPAGYILEMEADLPRQDDGHGRLDEEKFDGRVSDRIDPRPALPIYLTPKKVARMLEVDERTVLRWAAEDPSMPTIRIGRVIRWEQDALFRWLAKKRPRKSMS